jgi:hypothetical protein
MSVSPVTGTVGWKSDSGSCANIRSR